MLMPLDGHEQKLKANPMQALLLTKKRRKGGRGEEMGGGGEMAGAGRRAGGDGGKETRGPNKETDPTIEHLAE